MKLEISIVSVKPEELALLCELDVTIFGSDAFDSPEDWEDDLRTYFILADSRIVGSLALRHDTEVGGHYTTDYLVRPGSLYIVSIGIVPRFQKCGIGTRVMQWIVDYGHQQKFHRIVSNARSSNYPSTKLHTKCGFKVTRLIPEWYEDPTEDAAVLELELKNAS